MFKAYSVASSSLLYTHEQFGQESDTIQGAAMNEWKAFFGRITLFPVVQLSPLLSAIELYQRVWHGGPDTFQKQTNPLAPSVAQGTRGGMTVACLTHPSRIDFNLTPVQSPPQELAQMSLPIIEDTSKLHAELMRIMDVIGKEVILGSVVRVALNVQFLALKQSSEEANSTLMTVIPDQYGIRITDEKDFIFQINRPYTSREVGEIKMNAVTKWSVDRLQVLTIAVPMSGTHLSASVEAALPKPQTKEFIAASVSFDINNVPSENQLSGSQQTPLLREALTTVAQTQQDIGLNVEGFQNV
jgi:hypothetical protein